MHQDARGESDAVRYDRQLLLLGAKRNAELQLAEVLRYGRESYGDADYVSIYGLKPHEWFARGVRMLGRTAVECTRDELGDAIGRDVAVVVNDAPVPRSTRVIDPFCGSGNTLYWLLRHVPGARGTGFELDPAVFGLTARNLAAMQAPIELIHEDYRTGLGDVDVSDQPLLVFFIAPPWGEALDRDKGLDLRRTTPPITEILRLVAERFPNSLAVFAIQVFERVDPGSIAELRPIFDWHTLRTYHLNAPGQNHGILLGTRGFAPKVDLFARERS